MSRGRKQDRKHRVPLTSDFRDSSFRKTNKIRCLLIRTMTLLVEASHQIPVLKLGLRRSRNGTETEKEWGVWQEVQHEAGPSDQKVPGPYIPGSSSTFFTLFRLQLTCCFFVAPYIFLQPRAMNLHVSYDPNNCGKSKGTEKKDFLISTVQGHNPYPFPC